MIKLYDRMGDFVMDCRDLRVAAKVIVNGFGGCGPEWIDSEASEGQDKEFFALIQKERQELFLTKHYYDVLLRNVTADMDKHIDIVDIKYSPDHKTIEYIDICFSSGRFGLFISGWYEEFKKLENTNIFQIVVGTKNNVELITQNDETHFSNLYFRLKETSIPLDDMSY